MAGAESSQEGFRSQVSALDPELTSVPDSSGSGRRLQVVSYVGVTMRMPGETWEQAGAGQGPERCIREMLSEHVESLLAVTLEARAARIADGLLREGGRRRYPVALSKDAEGWWSVGHHFSSLGVLEIVKVLLLGSDEAVVVGAEVVDLQRPEAVARSPFGPGERTAGLALPRWLFGTDERRAELVEPLAEWRSGETVRFRTTGEVEAGALVCRRKGTV